MIRIASLKEAQELSLDFWCYGCAFVDREGHRIDPRNVSVDARGAVSLNTSPFEEPSYEYVGKGFDFVDRWHERREVRRASK